MKAYVNSTRLRPIAAGVTVAIATMMFHPAVAQVTGQPTLPGEPCQTEPLEEWTPQEKWVWRMVCRGEIADFNKEYWYVWYGGDLDPNEREGWPENRVLTPRFLETILLHEPFRSAQTRRGVRIVGAWFKDPIDLRGGEIKRDLSLDRSRLDNGATLDDVRAGSLSLKGSVVAGQLRMQRAEIESLYMGGGAKFQEVDLSGAKIGVQLDMSGSTFAGTLNMDSAAVEGNLLMHKGAKFKEVNLIAAKIGGQLSMDGSTFVGKLDMNGVTVEGNLFMGKAAECQDVDLRGAKIAGRLDMHGSRFAGTLNMAGVTVGGDLFMHEEAKFKEVELLGAKIGGQLSMDGSTFAGKLDMDGATVAGDLFMRGGANFREVKLLGAKIGDDIVMDSSTFAGKLDMNSVSVESHLFMRHAEFQVVDLRAAKIAGQLDMYDSTFVGTLDMRSATVEGSLYLDGADLTKAPLEGESLSVGGNFDLVEAEVREINLHGAKIAGQLDMHGSTFAGQLDMRRATVGGDLLLHRADLTEAPLLGEWLSVGENLDLSTANVSRINLHGAKIAGQLDMHESTFAGELDMRSATVGRHLLLIDANLNEAPLFGRWLSVGGDLDLSSAEVKVINLRGASVVGELWLFVSDWKHGSSLDLRDAKVGRLVASVRQSSPVTTRLAGFIYDALGSTESQTPKSNPAEEAADAVERWLREEAVHSPQAHEQFARVLRQMGFPGRASRTLYEGKNHELWQELRRVNLLQAGGLFVLWAMIGYGYRVWYGLVWIAVLVAVGWRIARKSGRKIPDTDEPLGFWYSLDRLLPIMVLRKHHYEIDLPPRSRVYFYFHMFMGYVLAMFLLAGLSGLVGSR